MAKVFEQISRSVKTIFYIPKGAAVLLGNPRLLSLCFIPVLFGIVAALASLVAFFVYRDSITNLLGFNSDTWYFGLFAWLIFLLGSIISALTGFITASVAGGFFIEQLIEKLFERKNLKTAVSAAELTFLRSTFRSLLSESVLIIALALCTTLAFFLSFIPFLALLPLFVAAMLAGANLYFVSLGVLQYSLKERLHVVKQHWLTCLLLGTLFTASLAIPFAAIILMPLFYATVVEVIAADDTLRP